MRFYLSLAAIAYLAEDLNLTPMPDPLKAVMMFIILTTIVADIRDAFGSRCQHKYPEKPI